MDMEFDKLKNIIATYLKLDPNEITEDTAFEKLGADSLDLLQILLELQTEFGIEVPEEKVTSIQTVGEALELIKSELGSAE